MGTVKHSFFIILASFIFATNLFAGLLDLFSDDSKYKLGNLYYTLDKAIAELNEQLTDGLDKKVEDMKKVRLAILPFVNSDQKRSKLGQEIAESLQLKFEKEGDVTLYDRSKVDGLADKHNLNKNGLLGNLERKQMAAIMGTHTVVAGKIKPSGNNYIVSARVVDLQADTVLASGRILVYGSHRHTEKYKTAFDQD